ETRTVLAPVPGGLTAEVVAERSLASSHTVRARLAELDAARARLDQTTAQFFPRLTLRASYTRLSPVSAELGGALVGAGNPGLLSTGPCPGGGGGDRKSTRLNSSHVKISYAVFCLKKKNKNKNST